MSIKRFLQLKMTKDLLVYKLLSPFIFSNFNFFEGMCPGAEYPLSTK
jgi:hypothetical protein